MHVSEAKDCGRTQDLTDRYQRRRPYLDCVLRLLQKQCHVCIFMSVYREDLVVGEDHNS